MLYHQSPGSSVLLIILLLGGTSNLLGQYGYPIEVSFEVRNCETDEDPDCTLYSFYSFLKWSGEEYQQLNNDMGTLLQSSLQDRLNHWQFVRGEETKVSLQGAVVDEGAGLTKTMLELSLNSPPFAPGIGFGQNDGLPSRLF